jgi:FAD/FMN-containing dehydrogenase
MLNTARLQALRHLLGAAHVITQDEQLARLSRDYSWFSPVIGEYLRSFVADVAVAPGTTRQLAEVLGLAYEWRCPVTVRGGGTGNYGQAVPLSGGILLLTHRLDRVLDLAEDSVTVQAGCRLGQLTRTLQERGHDLRILPSTYLTSSTGGFVAGGTGGIGSITWGTLYDSNVSALSVLDLSGTARLRRVTGDALGTLIHTYGTVGVIAEVTLPTAPHLPWSEALYSFPTLDHAADFARWCVDAPAPKRLVSLHEWPIPTYFTALHQVGAIQHGRACVLLEAVDAHGAAFRSASGARGGFLTWAAPPAAYHRSPIGLSNFSFNHTTLAAKLADPSLTYLQVGLDINGFREQITQVRAQYPYDIAFHVELMRRGGALIAAALPLFSFRGMGPLGELMRAFENVGARVISPHTYLLDLNRAHPDTRRAKERADPRHLLNPGKWESAETAKEPDRAPSD